MKAWDDGSHDPGFQKFYARAIVTAARNFRRRDNKASPWTHTLLEWAGKARRRAQQLAPRDLFGAAP